GWPRGWLLMLYSDNNIDRYPSRYPRRQSRRGKRVTSDCIALSRRLWVYPLSRFPRPAHSTPLHLSLGSGPPATHRCELRPTDPVFPVPLGPAPVFRQCSALKDNNLRVNVPGFVQKPGRSTSRSHREIRLGKDRPSADR